MEIRVGRQLLVVNLLSGCQRHRILGTERDGDAIPTTSIMPVSSMTLLTLPDVNRLQKFYILVVTQEVDMYSGMSGVGQRWSGCFMDKTGQAETV